MLTFLSPQMLGGLRHFPAVGSEWFRWVLDLDVYLSCILYLILFLENEGQFEHSECWNRCSDDVLNER